MKAEIQVTASSPDGTSPRTGLTDTRSLTGRVAGELADNYRQIIEKGEKRWIR